MMKNIYEYLRSVNLKQSIGGGIVLTAIALFGLAVAKQDTLGAYGGDSRLEGTWDIAITQAGTLTSTPFRILRTISSGGVVDSYAFPAFTLTPGVVNSSGHGDWRRISNNVYSVTVKYFQLNYAASGQPPNILDTIGTVRETVTLSKDGNSYTSEFETTISLPDGTVVLTNPGKTSAKRMPVIPLLP